MILSLIKVLMNELDQSLWFFPRILSLINISPFGSTLIALDRLHSSVSYLTSMKWKFYWWWKVQISSTRELVGGFPPVAKWPLYNTHLRGFLRKLIASIWFRVLCQWMMSDRVPISASLISKGDLTRQAFERGEKKVDWWSTWTPTQNLWYDWLLRGCRKRITEAFIRSLNFLSLSTMRTNLFVSESIVSIENFIVN